MIIFVLVYYVMIIFVNHNTNHIDDTQIIYEGHETCGNDNNYFNNNNDGIDAAYRALKNDHEVMCVHFFLNRFVLI